MSLALALAACGGGFAADNLPVAAVPNGPAADYPIVVGDPYTVAGVTYTPEDVLNYDEVGYVAIDPSGGNAISGEHHTLPLPSYVEVTSLETGQTILVRLERRGPMTGNFLVGLSPGASSQLGVTAGSPVRVRRVNPPEQERAMLRGGEQAPARMETPTSLVNVLRRKLPGGEGPLPTADVAITAPPASSTADASAGSPLALPPLDSVVSAAPAQRPALPPPEIVSSSTTSRPAAGDFVVQAGAFSNLENADRVARVIEGEVTQTGSLYRVRTGPFASRNEAEASLATVRAAGYSDARIFEGG